MRRLRDWAAHTQGCENWLDLHIVASLPMRTVHDEARLHLFELTSALDRIHVKSPLYLDEPALSFFAGQLRCIADFIDRNEKAQPTKRKRKT